MNSNESFLVGIHCMTYNHASYIEDALNGFVMQKTSFPYFALVVDDASLDGEQEIIKSYLEKHFDHSENTGYKQWETDDASWIYARHKENENCFFVVVFLKRNLFGNPQKWEVLKDWLNITKYIAICEGDDYWTDPMKLQKQVDFLEAYEDYSMCFHAAKILLQGVDKKKTGAQCEHIEARDYSSTEVFERWIVPTASIVYRKKMIDQFVMKHPEWLTRGDIALVLKCSHSGKIRGMSDCMSVYRMQPNSVSHNPQYRGKEVFRLPNHFRCIFINFHQVDKAPVKWNIASAYFSRMKAERGIDRIRDFFLAFYWDPQLVFKKTKKMVVSHFSFRNSRQS